MTAREAEVGGALTPPDRYVDALAQLAVGIGANVQPGQIVAISTEPGQEAITRAVADAAYARGAKFVDVSLFDPYIKHSRLVHADRETLSYVPPWLGERAVHLGELNAARIGFQGPIAPRLMDDVDPELLGLDLLPRVKEAMPLVMKQLTNWTALPFPHPAWASVVHPELSAADAYARLWEEVAVICRLDAADPTAAWADRLEALEANGRLLTQTRLDAVHFLGPGTDLTVGLLPSSQWMAGRMETVTGIVHAPNLPTEEVFTAPDPLRVDGVVRSTKPLFIQGGGRIDGLSVRFEDGRAVEINADRGAETLRALTSRDEGGARLGEVALVDRESRVGQSGTIFANTLLDENAASHIALGAAYPFSVGDEADKARVNTSEIHIDFMIGSNEVAVDGLRGDGSVVPLLRNGTWQI